MRAGTEGSVVFVPQRYCSLIKYDADKGEPLRDSRGFCVEVDKGAHVAIFTREQHHLTSNDGLDISQGSLDFW